MKPFLYQVASLFYSKYGAEVSRLAFVFPNRRTGLFFQKYLSEVSEKPLFSPTILTINDLFVQLSGKQTADRISMLFKLYDIYLNHSGSSETFDEFLYWGEMLLNDFDDIDKYMVDARMLFTNVTDLREIENDFSFLSPEQIAAIRTFWSSFYPKGDTPNQEQFLAVWQILYALYTDLRETLAAEGKGYEGMIFREVVEQMEKNECCDLPYTKVVFVGLNALSVAEERFLSELQKREIADFYWDYASPKVTDPDNKASYFVERNLRRFPSQLKVESGELKVESEDSNAEPLSTFNSQLSTINDIEQEFIFHYFATVNRMKEVMREANVEMKIDTYFRLLKRVTDTITIPFHGEPLSGLQIMGVLETRALDFDRLIILSMNEGIFPLRKAANSFIPYNLRRGFGLPTYEHQDSVWAYHFYRLIYRASHVSLLYDTRSNGLQTGEVSRFVHQLHYHYEEPIQNKLVVYNVSSSKTPALQVAKTEEVMNRLVAFRSGGTRAISASAVNTYLDCPLKFYFSVVEGIREEEEVSETIESNVFGSILHKVMEELYQPFCGKMVTADLLKAIRKDTPMLTGAIARAFAEIFFKTDIVRPLTGQNFLIGEMIRKYVEKVLERDAKLTPFRYIESEKQIKCLFPLTDKSNIQLKGFIDRIDEVRDTVRIIDYKSGSGTTQFTSVEALFDKEDTDRSKAVMQVFMYAWMYGTVQLSTAIQPGIYYMRTLFSPSFDPGIYRRTDRFKTEQVLDFANYHADFENSLRNCLDEIFDTETPFVQTPNGKACVYCPFKDICGK